MNNLLFFALAGQPNCGKSTLFNAVAGYRAITSNFPGTTVEYTQTHIHLGGKELDLIDLPGIYSLSGAMDKSEEETLKFLINSPPDVIINVVDSSVLSRSLEFTLELMGLNIPMVLCLNMMDEAEKKGIKIDFDKLEKILGIPAVPTVALKGRGVREVFTKAIKIAESKSAPKKLNYYLPPLQKVIEECENLLETEKDKKRFYALEVLTGNPIVEKKLNLTQDVQKRISNLKNDIKDITGEDAQDIVIKERHAFAMKVFEEVAEVKKGSQRSFENRVDSFLLTGWRGYTFTTLFFFFMLFIIFFIGSNIEEVFLSPFDALINTVKRLPFPLSELSEGVLQGIAGGIAIVLPYLIPLIFFLSYSEDIGLLPRIAFVFDTIMHRIGLHGKSVIPLIMGYGCSVPAIMGTKILESESERRRVAYLSTLIPCSARTTVILATVGLFAGFKGVILLYLINLLVVGIVSTIISAGEQETPGLIIEIPPYRLPPLSLTLSKTWFRIKDFIFKAWPILIIGSIILSFARIFKVEGIINYALSPLTANALGLPQSVGLTLVFGLLRKELAMLMLFQALGTTDIMNVMTLGQLLTFAVFITFYIPCVATLYYIWRNFGWKFTLFSALFSTFIAIFLASLTAILFTFSTL